MNSLVNIHSRNDKPVKELVVISGKGGTGKTSLVASFASLANHAVLADCDVDAADLHLLASPHVMRSKPFTGGKRATINTNFCSVCGHCEDLCRFDAIHLNGPGNMVFAATYQVDPMACEGCGVCAWFCPNQAIQLDPAINGTWFVSETRFGPMVHACLGAGAENSGKLVSLVRTTAKQIAEERHMELVLIDGSPGIGCPVIASITGVDLALIVTEPTPSGLHDMQRVAELTRHFGIPAAVCVNKWDLNPEMSKTIEAAAQERGLTAAGRVRYDPAVTEAQVHEKAIVEYRQDGSAADIRKVWRQLRQRLLQGRPPSRVGQALAMSPAEEVGIVSIQ
ncbi:MAG: ATP-binding protein [Terracidiphilus sp.]